MRWKTNKTKPVKNGLDDKIVIVDVLGYFHFDVELTGWGKGAKIGNKSWNEIKDAVVFWQYMTVLRQDILNKLIKKWVEIFKERENYVRTLPEGFELFGGKHKGNTLARSEQEKIQQFLSGIGVDGGDHRVSE